MSKLEERRRLIDSFVNSVTVFDDYILITFNYKEGEERLDFTDIESSDLQSVGGPKRMTPPNLNSLYETDGLGGVVLWLKNLTQQGFQPFSYLQ